MNRLASSLVEGELSFQIIGCAMKVHNKVGPGLLESAYRECLCFELRRLGLEVELEKSVPLIYETIKLDRGYRLDLLVENKIVVELKVVNAIADVHLQQLLTYLRFGNYRLGLLINFHVSLLKNGIQRVVN